MYFEHQLHEIHNSIIQKLKSACTKSSKSYLSILEEYTITNNKVERKTINQKYIRQLPIK